MERMERGKRIRRRKIEMWRGRNRRELKGVEWRGLK